jgi:uncharacterized membrane protein YqhA
LSSTAQDPVDTAAREQQQNRSLRPYAAFVMRVAQVLVVIGILTLFAAAATLVLFGAFETFRHILKIITLGEPFLGTQEMVLSSIKLVDLILLATVLQLVAVALYTMFVDPQAPIPGWLRTNDVEGLKRKLASVIVIMLGVVFLEEVIYWRSERNLLPLGVGVAAMIVALTYYIVAKARSS